MSEFENCELECGAHGSYCKCRAEKDQASECPSDAGCSTADFRAPVKELEGTFPVVLYFGNDNDREEFIAVMAEVMPNAIAKKL